YRRRVGRDHGPRAGERLEHLVRDYPGPLVARPEDAERATGGTVGVRQLLVRDPGDVLDIRGPSLEQAGELAVADDPEPDVGHLRRRGEDRLETVQRDQLPDEDDVERLRRVVPGPEERLVGAHERDRDALLRQAEGTPEEH